MPPDPRYKVKDQAEQEDQGCETWETRWLEWDYKHQLFIILLKKCSTNLKIYHKNH